MKTIITTLMVALGSLSWNLSGAETAQARMFCLSLRFQEGSSSTGSTLDLSTLPTPAAANGELAPWFGQFTHTTIFRLNDPSEIDLIEGTMDIDLPISDDLNGNGFPDFFESSQGVSATTAGAWDAGFDSGTVRATWSRGAGSKDGTCVLRLTSTMFGLLGDFSHTFELIEYSGSLSYIPGTNTVSGAINLVQTGDASHTLTGPMDLLKSPTNRFNRLELQTGSWTNAAAQTLALNAEDIFHDQQLGTNYYGSIDFADGDPNTPESDYTGWVLSIDDANDRDADGIPDLSDDPVSDLARAPQLVLSVGATSMTLTVSGTIGRLHEVQKSISLAGTNWSTTFSFTPTSDPQIVPLPLPADPTYFLRVRVP